MSTEPENSATVDESADAARIKQDIEQTRDNLSETVAALEERLSPSTLRTALREEVQEVEQKVRAVLGEQLTEAKTLVQTELREAKDALHTGLVDAERMIRSGLHDAKETTKNELKSAVNDAKDSLRAATIGRVENFATQAGDTMNDVRDTLFETIRQNPLPATLAGVGIGWLLMNRSRSESFRARGYGGNGTYSTHMGPRAGERVGQMGAALGRATEQASGAVAHGLQGVAETASDVIEGASGMATNIAHTAAEGVSQAASAVTGGASALSGSAHAGAKRVEQTFQRQLQERPLAVGAAAIAIGTMVGCAMPRTRVEDELLGEASNSMLARAGDVVHEAAASVGIGAGEQRNEETQRRRDEGGRGQDEQRPGNGQQAQGAQSGPPRSTEQQSQGGQGKQGEQQKSRKESEGSQARSPQR